ncbi:MAG: tRNA (adenosine(37)-N6)-threonylcarbamoyltransferase complex ATPase subunit type 1 TsaE [Patescibacteria group bacterium]|nr:tRNA (adenosine(37)-N6)-threonylcarbamoyltransferase complex ATPase subunit type 1 TsaE [Patescibacteria group bacterium]
MKFITNSLAETHTLGEKMGKKLKGDETIALIGDLGAGKTAFVQGLAKGLGAKAAVTSPTFVLEKIYKGTGNRMLHHFDVYRIEGEDVGSTGLLEILGEVADPGESLTRRGIVVIEWADKIKSVLPRDTIWIRIMHPSETKREFIFDIPESRDYLRYIA